MTTDISIEGYEPPHLSYSSIDGYRSCGKRFELQKVISVEQRPGLAALAGNAVHTATEWWDTGEWVKHMRRFTSSEAFEIAWDKEVAARREQSPSWSVEDYIATGRAAAAYGGKKTIAYWQDHGPSMVQAWLDWREESGWSLWETPDDKPAVEVEINQEVAGTTVKAFLDRIMVTPVGQLVVLDIKTGRTPETPEQLGLYALLIEKEFGEMFRPAWGYYWTPDKGQGSPLSLDMYTEGYFADIIKATTAGVNAGAFLAKPANGCARWCGVAQFCTAVGGRLPDHFKKH